MSSQVCLFAPPPRGGFALSRMKGVRIRARPSGSPPRDATKAGDLVCYHTLVRVSPRSKWLSSGSGSRFLPKPVSPGVLAARYDGQRHGQDIASEGPLMARSGRGKIKAAQGPARPPAECARREADGHGRGRIPILEPASSAASPKMRDLRYETFHGNACRSLDGSTVKIGVSGKRERRLGSRREYIT